MSVLICGSLAYDTIMVFHDKFKNHILPDKIHILNVSFMVPALRREFGGCAGNIAYNLNLLCDAALPMGTAGNDFKPYAKWMHDCGIRQDYITVLQQQYTAQAFITTDEDDNQINAFHPGAMNESHINTVPVDAGIALGIISPDGRQGMIEHAEQFVAAGIPFVFDPGQGLPMFGGEELRHFIRQAAWVVVNDYESQLLQQRTGFSEADIAAQVEAYIITHGAAGSLIYSGSRQIKINSITTAEIKDPTGCGDAYRAGLLYGFLNKLDWQTTGRLASVMGGIKIEHAGTQNHRPSRDEIAARYQQSYGEALVWCAD